jgi:hypothetical protein
MLDYDREQLEQEMASLGQIVATLLADMKLELAVVRQLLAEQGLIQPDVVNKRIASLRNEQMASLTMSTSVELQNRFSALCRRLGSIGKAHPN